MDTFSGKFTVKLFNVRLYLSQLNTSQKISVFFMLSQLSPNVYNIHLNLTKMIKITNN